MIPTEHPTIAQLWTAAHVCHDCGCDWGSPRPEPEHVSRHEAACHICGVITGVAHVRHYGYLRRGLALVEGRSRG